jgi:hypothetical protein
VAVYNFLALGVAQMEVSHCVADRSGEVAPVVSDCLRCPTARHKKPAEFSHRIALLGSGQ